MAQNFEAAFGTQGFTHVNPPQTNIRTALNPDDVIPIVSDKVIRSAKSVIFPV